MLRYVRLARGCAAVRFCHRKVVSFLLSDLLDNPGPGALFCVVDHDQVICCCEAVAERKHMRSGMLVACLATPNQCPA